MAERRMFSKTVCESDKFLELSLSAQALYFHLSLNADDDGMLNNAKTVMKIIECEEKYLNELKDKGFIKRFDDTGVVGICHWSDNNLIRKDRKKQTVYDKEFSKMNDNQMTTNCQPNGDIQGAQYSVVECSIGKDSVVECSIVPNNNVYTPKLTDKQTDELRTICKELFQHYIDRLVEYRTTNPDSAKYNDFLTIKKWYNEDKEAGNLPVVLPANYGVTKPKDEH